MIQRVSSLWTTWKLELYFSLKLILSLTIMWSTPPTFHQLDSSGKPSKKDLPLPKPPTKLVSSMNSCTNSLSLMQSTLSLPKQRSLSKRWWTLGSIRPMTSFPILSFLNFLHHSILSDNRSCTWTRSSLWTLFSTTLLSWTMKSRLNLKKLNLVIQLLFPLDPSRNLFPLNIDAEKDFTILNPQITPKISVGIFTSI